MKFSVYLPDPVVAEIDAAAAELGITRSEWLRRGCDRLLHPADTRAAPADTQAEAVEDAVSAAIARAERAEAELEAERRGRAVAEAIAAERATHIENLLRSLAAVEGLSRRALPGPAPERERLGDRLRRFFER